MYPLRFLYPAENKGIVQKQRDNGNNTYSTEKYPDTVRVVSIP